MRILLADDEPQVRWLYRQMLVGSGFEVEAASDGLDALSKVMSEPFDLMILDLKMPRLDGFEVLARMKEAEKDVPVIVMTGHFPEEVVADRLKGLEGLQSPRIVEVLRKPVMITTLLNSVKRATS